ncbi:uncharacterized protein LOC116795349 isoform X1 [Chiroxiphia lanceolata]|uniref:uncharacterized protein LOC116795349 isoform X1 n=1 Tax=Chiroxiphia lanceolata TaxID=296741 RepID=UPI0013CE5870|nr:uncharacterized protein LOC116795349 isoform X1 [Chiroxiphia lanceolata]
MDPKLLDLPLAVKIPVFPGSKPVLCRAKLGEKLHRPFPYFTLDDPYNHHLTIQYNCLHDPLLRDYHHRKDVLKLLRRQGFVTRDNNVVCTLKEFNEYRQYLTRHRDRSEQMLMRKEGRTQPPLAKSKHGPKRPGTTNTSRQAEQQLKAQKPSCPPQPKNRKTPLKSGQIYSRAGLGQEGAKKSARAQSQRKPDAAASGLFEQSTEAQKLEELAEIVVQKVLERLKVPGDKRVSCLRRIAQAIRGRFFGSCMRVELSDPSVDHREEMEAVAKELVATVLEILGERLASSMSKAPEPGAAARQKEQPVVGGATQAGERKENETATLDIASAQSSLDKLTREVVESVNCTLQSFVASQFEQDSTCEHTEILELPGGNDSNRQLQPGFPGASEQENLEANTGAKLPALEPQQRVKGTGRAKTVEPEGLATVEENLEKKMNLEATALADSLDIRSMADRIADSVLARMNEPEAALTTQQDCKGPVANPRISHQPIPPAGPKPPAQAGARHRAVRPQPV